jgi:hypothetical protein
MSSFFPNVIREETRRGRIKKAEKGPNLEDFFRMKEWLDPPLPSSPGMDRLEVNRRDSFCHASSAQG